MSLNYSASINNKTITKKSDCKGAGNSFYPFCGDKQYIKQGEKCITYNTTAQGKYELYDSDPKSTKKYTDITGFSPTFRLKNLASVLKVCEKNMV